MSDDNELTKAQEIESADPPSAHAPTDLGRRKQSTTEPNPADLPRPQPQEAAAKAARLADAIPAEVIKLAARREAARETIKKQIQDALAAAKAEVSRLQAAGFSKPTAAEHPIVSTADPALAEAKAELWWEVRQEIAALVIANHYRYDGLFAEPESIANQVRDILPDFGPAALRLVLYVAATHIDRYIDDHAVQMSELECLRDALVDAVDLISDSEMG